MLEGQVAAAQHAHSAKRLLRHHCTSLETSLRDAQGMLDRADTERPFLARAAQVALRHHERWDGSGYPGNLTGEQCPYDARIVAVADVYDALGQPRCYKPGWSDEEIEAYFRNTSGTLFEPKIVDALLASRPRLLEIAASLPDPMIETPLVSCVRASPS
jgi:response regulator RpfG family c-di-GMP phosphodiesterase